MTESARTPLALGVAANTLRESRRTGVIISLFAASLVACGESTASTSVPWMAGHPNTAAVAFDASAPGLCALIVRYPDEAPAVINYLGKPYVQASRTAHATAAPGDKVVDHSGNWQVDQQSSGNLVLLTPSSTFGYRPETGC